MVITRIGILAMAVACATGGCGSDPSTHEETLGAYAAPSSRGHTEIVFGGGGPSVGGTPIMGGLGFNGTECKENSDCGIRYCALMNTPWGVSHAVKIPYCKPPNANGERKCGLLNTPCSNKCQVVMGVAQCVEIQN